MTRSFDPTRRRVAGGLAAAVAAAIVPGCGGGDGVGSGGTGSFALGPISGFGSIIVNGIRYDDASAQVRDADDAQVPRGALALGMVVEVSGSSLTVVDGVRTGVATTIRYASEVVGPVTAIDPAAGTLVVLGQAVRVDAATVFAPQPLTGLVGLRTGDIVEVYGLSGGTALLATRIELEPAADRFELRGTVSALDPASRTFRVAGVLVDGSGLGTLPADGQQVRVRLRAAARPGDGAYPVESLRGADRRLEDRAEVEIEGLVTAWQSPARFSVDGIPIDASGASVPAALASNPLGRRVEVEGRLSCGVLLAREVELEDGDDDGEGGGTGASADGPIASVDPASRTFVVRGRTVRWNDATRFDDGTAAGLRVGVTVEVDGVAQPDGSLRATEIEFD